eukprot:gene51360-68742_t
MAIAALMLSLSACQTSGGPSPSSAALLESQGFKPTSIADLNKDLAADDLRTTAAYDCEKPRCRSDILMIFGVDPTPDALGKDLDMLLKASPKAQAKLFRAVFGTASQNFFVGISGSSFLTPDGGKGVRISGRVNPSKVPSILQSERFYLGMTYIQRNGIGRVVMAIAGDSASAVRQRIVMSLYTEGLGRNPANFQPLTPLSFLDRAARVWPEHLAVIHGGMRMTYRVFEQRCRRLASGLQKCGIGKGDTVSVLFTN